MENESNFLYNPWRTIYVTKYTLVKLRTQPLLRSRTALLRALPRNRRPIDPLVALGGGDALNLGEFDGTNTERDERPLDFWKSDTNRVDAAIRVGSR